MVMENSKLNAAVERLLRDPDFLRGFRRNPARALRRFELTGDEVEAIKRGRTEELLALGVDPAYVDPEIKELTSPDSWLIRNARLLAPAAFIAAVLAFWPTTANAKPGHAISRVRILRSRGVGLSGIRRAVSTPAGEKSVALQGRQQTLVVPGLRRAVLRLKSNSGK